MAAESHGRATRTAPKTFPSSIVDYYYWCCCCSQLLSPLSGHERTQPFAPRVVLLPLLVAWICTILIGNNSRRMRLQLFLVASRGGMILEMGQTRVQKSVYFSFGNGNDLVSGMWSSELVVNWGLLFGGRFSLLGCSSRDIVEIFGKYYYGKGKIGW